MVIVVVIGDGVVDDVNAATFQADCCCLIEHLRYICSKRLEQSHCAYGMHACTQRAHIHMQTLECKMTAHMPKSGQTLMLSMLFVQFSLHVIAGCFATPSMLRHFHQYPSISSTQPDLSISHAAQLPTLRVKKHLRQKMENTSCSRKSPHFSSPDAIYALQGNWTAYERRFSHATNTHCRIRSNDNAVTTQT